jgi:glucose 1-dehydrogenase
LAPQGIRVNTVSPGVVVTEIHQDPSEAALARRSVDTPLRRPGQPEEIAAAVRFALSPAASFMTGATITVSGGR